MKTRNYLFAALLLLAGFGACTNNHDGRFLNLSTGQEVTLVKGNDGEMVDRATNRPVLLYVDPEKRDTFYGPTGERVNGHLWRSNKGGYVYDDGERKIKIDGDEFKIKGDGAKEKWDADGSEYKYKDDDRKVKEDDGEYKVKTKNYEKKRDEDGDVKIKTADKTIKVDGETGEKKVKKRSVFGKVKDKVIGG